MKTRVSLRYFASYCKSIEHFKIVKNLLELLKLLKSLTSWISLECVSTGLGTKFKISSHGIQL